jgi:6-phosphofructokinase 1
MNKNCVITHIYNHFFFADCMQLGQNAVHGAMAGFTGFSVGLCNNRMVFLPIPELVSTSPRSMNPHGRTWERILALTRQPNTVE